MGSPASAVGPRLAVLVVLALLAQGCAARSAPVVVAQAALGAAQAVGQLQLAAEQLHRAGSLDTRTALAVQERLLRVNARLGEIVPVLRALDRVQQAGAPVTVAEVEVALSMVIAVSQELSLVVAGVPVSDATRQLLEAVRVAQQAVATTLVEIARLRAALES